MANRGLLVISAVTVFLAAVGCGSGVPASAPAPTAQQLLGAGIAYDPGNGSVIAFGGQQRAGRRIGPSDLTWRWTGDRWQPVATAAPPGRSAALLAAEPSGRGLLLFGGQAETSTLPSCPAPSTPQPCTASGGPSRLLSDTWTFADGTWKHLPAGPGAPQQGELLAGDPAIDAVVLVGQSLAYTPSSTQGTWKRDGNRWSLLSPTSPEQADSMGYDPVSHLLIAYGGMQPSTPSGDAGAAGTLGYSQTWALTGTGWVELHPATIPGRAPGVLTPSPDLRRLLLVTTLGQTWTWTGHDWQRYQAPGATAGRGAAWAGATLAAATDPSRHQVVLLVTSDSASDQTWILSGGRWVRQPATP
jgi:hypothetical protein